MTTMKTPLIIKRLYGKRFEQEAFDMLKDSKFITVHEYHNFVDFDLIPFIRKYIENNKEVSR